MASEMKQPIVMMPPSFDEEKFRDWITTDQEGGKWLRVSSDKMRKIDEDGMIDYGRRMFHIEEVCREIEVCSECRKDIDIDEPKVKCCEMTKKDVFMSICCESCFETHILSTTDVVATSYIEDLEDEYDSDIPDADE